MSSRINLAVKKISQTGKTHSGTVIFLHGSGDSGPGVHEWVKHLVKDFEFPHLQILFPTAPSRPYTPADGEHSNVWFDRKQITKHVEEDLPSIDVMAKEIVTLIDNEVKNGIPLNRIVLGGFSMGGALSFHVGYRFLPQLAGIFALSAFVNDGSVIFDDLKKQSIAKLPPLFQWHGIRDALVPMQWGQETFQALQTLGVTGEFHMGKNSFHELEEKCLKNLHTWIGSRIPE